MLRDMGVGARAQAKRPGMDRPRLILATGGNWPPRQDSNLQPPDSKSGALSVELRGGAFGGLFSVKSKRHAMAALGITQAIAETFSKLSR
jgi:hypothetical protein